LPTLNEVSALLANSLGIESARIAKIVRHLQDANLLPRGRRGPGGAAGCEIRDAAVLLLAILSAAGRPIEAPAFVRTIGALPATHLRALSPGNGAGQVLQFAPVEDIAIAPGYGPAVVGMTRSFLSFLETVIAAQAADVPPEYPPLPQTISVLGNLASPIAMADLPSLPGGLSALLFTDVYTDAQAVASRLSWSWHYASGAVLAQLGDLFAGRKIQLTAPAAEPAVAA
jgi:hypothetical protein